MPNAVFLKRLFHQQDVPGIVLGQKNIQQAYCFSPCGSEK
jgi:hypothetical protein